MDINLVSSSCVGAYLMRDYYKCEYQNPFAWTTILPHDMRELILNWDSLNWVDIDVKLSNNNLNKGTYPIIIINKLVCVRYVHIKFDPNARQPYTHMNDIWCNNIWEYAFNQYIKRLRRMLNNKLIPLFIWGGDWSEQCPTYDDIEYMNAHYNNKYKVIYAVNNSLTHCHNRVYAKWIWNTYLRGDV